MGQTRDIALLAAGAALSRPRVVEVGPREVHHHEHRAPTDESVRLLKEMEEKARAKIDETIRIEGNSFNAVIHLSREEWDDSTRARCICTLNGNKLEVDHAIGSRNFDGCGGREELLKGLHTKLAERIAADVLHGALLESPAVMAALAGKRY